MRTIEILNIMAQAGIGLKPRSIGIIKIARTACLEILIITKMHIRPHANFRVEIIITPEISYFQIKKSFGADNLGQSKVGDCFR